MSLLSKNLSLPRRSGGRPGSGPDVDPILAGLLGVVLVAGGGLAAYGATQDTEPAAAPVPVVQNDDPVVARALAVVLRADGGTATGEPASAADARSASARAERASARGSRVDPFGAVSTATAAGAGTGAATTTASSTAGGGSSSGASATPAGSSTAASGSSSASTGSSPAAGSGSASAGGTGSASAVEQARRAAAAAAARAAEREASDGSSAAPSLASLQAARRRAAATKPARVSLRLKTDEGRSARSKRPLGLLVPSASESVARVVQVSATNEVVTLRLRAGAALDGKQSKGTRCIQRLEDGRCRLVRVRTGRTAVLRAPASADGTPGEVTALRVLAVWRGGVKVAD